MTTKKFLVFKTSDKRDTEPEKFNSFYDALAHIRSDMFVKSSELNDTLDKAGVLKIIYGDNVAIIGVVSEVEYNKVSCCDVDPNKCAGMCGEDNG